MRVLHVVKTTDGARWAFEMVTELVKAGLKIHVLLPKDSGRFISNWVESGAEIHIQCLDFPIRNPLLLFDKIKQTKKIINEIKPDLIHSHFFGNTIMLRYALGKQDKIPRIFQIPGPLHLEHLFYRNWELSTSGNYDYWIGSSKFIKSLYIKYGVPHDKIFLSYYGIKQDNCVIKNKYSLRLKYNIKEDDFVVGNVNYMYAPKFYLGQTVGLKGHEALIEAIAQANKRNPKIKGLIVGGQWGSSSWYEKKLKRIARKKAGDNIIMPGSMKSEEIKNVWPNFDVTVHVPLSENCGGVIESLSSAIPTIASRTGGLPEVIINNVTGKLVDNRNTNQLIHAIYEVVQNKNHYTNLAQNGKKLVEYMFNVKRTSKEIISIYNFILKKDKSKPKEFSSIQYLENTYQA